MLLAAVPIDGRPVTFGLVPAREPVFDEGAPENAHRGTAPAFARSSLCSRIFQNPASGLTTFNSRSPFT